MRVSNREAKRQVANRWEFKTNNETVYGKWHSGNEGRRVQEYVYAVYSYGEHFPMFAHFPDYGWVGNKDKYSVTTSRHQNAVRPDSVREYVSTETLKEYIRNPMSLNPEPSPVTSGNNAETVYSGEEI
jgi:hypothetical protein